MPVEGRGLVRQLGRQALSVEGPSLTLEGPSPPPPLIDADRVYGIEACGTIT